VTSSELRAAVIAALLVVFAAAIGLAIGSRARPTPATASPRAITSALPSATPADPAETQRRAFAQPLDAGCATERAVWLFADGGTAIRFDGRIWTIPDPTLRSLSAASCDAATALAVGGSGSLLTIDEDQRQVRADRVGIDDLRSVARLPDGAIAVGSNGAVIHQTQVGWSPVGGSIENDLYGVAASGSTVWIVGAGGIAYHLTSAGWDPHPAPERMTLRAVAIPSIDSVIAAGDGGRIVRWTAAGWARVDAGTTTTLRAASVVGAATWVVGDRGTVIEVLGDRLRRIDLGTTCTLRAVFPAGAAVWVVGSDGTSGAAWRVTPSGIDRWGTC
jgi:hypothetical protein